MLVISRHSVLTTNARDRISLSFPGASIALTEKVCAPSESGETGVNGEEQAVSGLASKRHWKVEPGSLETNWKVGVGSLVKLPSSGPAVIVATGGVVSAVKLLKVP